MADEHRNGGAVVAAFVLGAITGAAIALLWAPAPGSETRRRLSERAREGRERARDALGQGQQFVERQRATINEAIERGREAYHQARGAAEPGEPGSGPAGSQA